MAHRAEELRLREEAWRERDAALTEREAEVNRREVAARRLGNQLTKREEAIAGCEARHLEIAKAERVAMAARSSELEAKEMEPASRGQPGDADLAGQLTTAQDTLVDLCNALKITLNLYRALIHFRNFKSLQQLKFTKIYVKLACGYF